MATRSFSTTIFIFFTLALATAPTSHSIPFILLYGLTDSCTNPPTLKLTKFLQEASGVEGQCLAIGNGALDSLYMPLTDQIQIACNKVKEMEHLKNGYNIVALSQGSIIGRGIVEFCDGAPPVKNFIALGGPHAGVAKIPYCRGIFGNLCPFVQAQADAIVYTEHGQNLMAPAGYYKLPTRIEEYLKYSKLLPKLNNERPEDRNTTYKERLSSLQNLVLIMFEGDTVVHPRETSWFGYYQDGSDKVILPLQQTELYKEDWIGLRTLDEAGKLTFYEVPGGHIEVTESIATEYVVPYLQDQPAKSVVFKQFSAEA